MIWKFIIRSIMLIILFIAVVLIFDGIVYPYIDICYNEVSLEQMNNNDEIVFKINEINAMRTVSDTIYYLFIVLWCFALGYNIFTTIGAIRLERTKNE